ncbi:uncharacterized protein CEXT_187881 [Caerostris extrusa]|uniref:DZANK-type domain-containing protein n=1 Tax=Caerostris extrusa TaxID=172846 RepID=A0AAV4MRD5_CAEEX|nr:uncharacterized protein CEXT_187881 [Caerostris extrusa]
MAPFSIPAPSIVPLRTPVFGGPRAIDTQTKIELMCETYLAHEIFYTLDGTKPQPYAGIVQGSKLYKYKSPFCLPAGKITIKAVALNTYVHTMRSSVVTKFFEVIKANSQLLYKKESAKEVKKKSSKVSRKKKQIIQEPTTSTPQFKEHVESVTFELDEELEISPRDNVGNLIEFPPDLEYFPAGDDVSESLSEVASLPSVSERGEELNKAQQEIEENILTTLNSSPSESDQNSHEEHETVLIDDSPNQIITEKEDKNLKIEKKLPSSENGEHSVYCIKCETILQHCRSCNTLNTTTSKFCIHCGEKMRVMCKHCKEYVSVLATFCHYCGKKFELNEEEPQVFYSDHSTMAEPQTMHAGVQKTLNTINRQTQTPPRPKEKGTNKDMTSQSFKRMPPHSPGRGYWHQQLDYICNHLKSYAYNNVEFRDSISEPMLSEFQKAQVIKSDDNISVTLSFTPFVMGE